MSLPEKILITVMLTFCYIAVLALTCFGLYSLYSYIGWWTVVAGLVIVVVFALVWRLID